MDYFFWIAWFFYWDNPLGVLSTHSMNKSGLIEVLSKEINLAKKKAEELVDVVFNTMSQSLINGERVEIRGLGSFVVKQYDGYLGRNPKTGEKIQIPPKKLPLFKVGKDLKERVDR